MGTFLEGMIVLLSVAVVAMLGFMGYSIYHAATCEKVWKTFSEQTQCSTTYITTMVYDGTNMTHQLIPMTTCSGPYVEVRRLVCE